MQIRTRTFKGGNGPNNLASHQQLCRSASTYAKKETKYNTNPR